MFNDPYASPQIDYKAMWEETKKDSVEWFMKEHILPFHGILIAVPRGYQDGIPFKAPFTQMATSGSVWGHWTGAFVIISGRIYRHHKGDTYIRCTRRITGNLSPKFETVTINP